MKPGKGNQFGWPEDRLRNGELFHRLGLSPAQIDKLSELIAEHELKVQDLKAASQNGGDESATGASVKISELNTQFEAGLREELGDPGYAQYQEYQGTRWADALLEELGGGLYDGSQPLTADQGEALRQVILADATGADGTSSRKNTDWDKVFNDAAGILSASQLTAWRASVANDQAWADVAAYEKAASRPPPK